MSSTNKSIKQLWFEAQKEIKEGKTPSILKPWDIQLFSAGRQRAPTTWETLQKQLDSKTQVKKPEVYNEEAADWSDDEEEEEPSVIGNPDGNLSPRSDDGTSKTTSHASNKYKNAPLPPLNNSNGNDARTKFNIFTSSPKSSKNTTLPLTQSPTSSSNVNNTTKNDNTTNNNTNPVLTPTPAPNSNQITPSMPPSTTNTTAPTATATTIPTNTTTTITVTTVQENSKESVPTPISVKSLWYEAQSELKLGNQPKILRKYNFRLNNIRQHNPKFKKTFQSHLAPYDFDLKVSQPRKSIDADGPDEEEDEEEDENNSHIESSMSNSQEEA